MVLPPCGGAGGGGTIPFGGGAGVDGPGTNTYMHVAKILRQILTYFDSDVSFRQERRGEDNSSPSSG